MSRNRKPHSRNSQSYDLCNLSQSYNLSRIVEDPKEIDEEDTQILKNTVVPRLTLRSIPTLPPISQDQSSAQYDFLLGFLLSLNSQPKIYKHFTESAVAQTVLKKPKLDILGFQAFRPRNLSTIVSPKSVAPQEPIAVSTSTIEETVQSMTPKPMSIDSKIFESHRRLSSKESISTPLMAKPQVKIPTLDRNSSDLFDQFKKIAGASDSNHKDYKLTFDLLKEYLSLRYPSDMCDNIIKWLYHGLSVSFEGWIQDMQKFMNYVNEKHCRIAFELYDINKDRYICTNDAFHVLSFENSGIYDQDLVKIRQAFLLKIGNEPHSSRLARRKKNTKNKAFLSAEDELKFKVPSIHPSKPEALTIQDFFRIQFALGKPQIIMDIIKYVTGIDLIEYNMETAKVLKRRKSEDIVEEMIFNTEFREKMQMDPMFGYYKELEGILLQFPSNYGNLALVKYNEMNISRGKEPKEITLASVTEIWPGFFGCDNKYISHSFYNYLCGPKNQNITKLSYLAKLKPLFSVISIKEATQNEFAFSIYDKNQDGLITCEEINEFFNTLCENSFVYKECLILINEFISSIFGKRHKQLEGIDYFMFLDLIGKSVLIDVRYIQEFTKALLMNEGQVRKNIAFCDRNELTAEELDSFKKYSHLLKNVELGENNRKYEEDNN